MFNAKKFLLIFLILVPLLGRSQQTLELDNDTLHLKLDLTRGGAINYISRSGTTRNIVNIHDEGRYIQQSYYAGKSVNRIADGQNPSWSPWSWNPIQVGDSYNNRAQILEYSQSGNTLYVKCIPMLWDMNNKPAEAEMEQWTTLQGNVIKVHNKLTCHRTDDIYGEGVSNHQELPAVYPISALKNLYSYFGQLPFTGAPLSNPEVVNLSSGFWGRYDNDRVTENWMAFVDDNLWGIGVYTPICTNFLAGMAGSPGFEAMDGSTSYIAPVKSEVLNKNSVYEYDYYLVVGTLNQIRSEIYNIKGVQENAWEFTDNAGEWTNSPGGGTVELSDGSLKYTITGSDAHLSKYLGTWIPGDLKYLWMRIRNETPGDSGAFHFFLKESDSLSVFFSLTPNDTQYKDLLIDLDTCDFWSKDLALNKFRWDPVTDGSYGIVYLDFIRFMDGIIHIRSEGNVQEINDLSKGLQLYAEEIPVFNTIEVEWSVDNSEIASINSSGLLTARYDGIVNVTATAKDGSGKTGRIQIIVNDSSQKNAWEFIYDLQGWDKNVHGGTVSHSDGTLKFSVDGGDPYVSNNVAPWVVGENKYLWMRIKNETAGTGGAIYIFPGTGGHAFVPFQLYPNDTEYRDIYLDMKTSGIWNSNLVLNSIRLDPNNDGAPGNIYVDFIRFLKEWVKVYGEGDAIEILGLGNTLQMFAEILAGAGGTDVTWQVNNPDVATIDQNGVLTAVSLGKVIVTASSKENTGFTGSTEVTISLENTKIHPFSTGTFEIYPNPAKEAIYLKNVKDIRILNIFTLEGNFIKQIEISQLNRPVKVGELNPGIYVIQAISVDRNIRYSRLVKQ